MKTQNVSTTGITLPVSYCEPSMNKNEIWTRISGFRDHIFTYNGWLGIEPRKSGWKPNMLPLHHQPKSSWKESNFHCKPLTGTKWKGKYPERIELSLQTIDTSIKFGGYGLESAMWYITSPLPLKKVQKKKSLRVIETRSIDSKSIILPLKYRLEKWTNHE